MSLALGTRLGPYEILSPLGAGGMGEVYKARDTRLERTVAVKVLPPHLASSPEARQRFEREAKAISRLSHPHICGLFDVGQQDGTDFLVMELLEGETLSARLAKGPLPLEDVVRYGIEMADALDLAHRQGIVHRDLKPGNVMLTQSGVKLLDFGLAKVVAPLFPRSDASESLTASMPADLTEEGTLLGTFQYMAPEQLEGRAADARSDIFAFGTVLYEMATGRKTFAGSSQAAIAGAIMGQEPPPISSLQPLSPPAFDRLVRNCLAKDPDRRWQTAHDIGLQLAGMGELAPQVAGTAPATHVLRRWMPWAVASAAVAAAVIAVFRPGVPSLPASPPVRFSVSPPPGGAFTLDRNVETVSLALSPDGSRIGFVASDPTGETRIWLRPLDGLEARPLVGTEGATSLFWSPDGRSIAFFAGDKLKRLDLPAGSPVPLCDVPENIGLYGTWGSGGQILFASNRGEAIFRVTTTGVAPSEVIKADRSRGEIKVNLPWFLPDGTRFLYLSRHSDFSGQLMLGELGKPPRRVLSVASNVQWVDPDYLVFVRDGTLVGQRFDLSSGRVTGDPFSIAESVNYFFPTGVARFSTSRNGVLVYQANRNRARIVWIDRSGREIAQLGASANYFSLRLSPDGSKAIIDRLEPGPGAYDLWSFDLERGIETRLTSGIASEIRGIWLSGGGAVVFSSVSSSGGRGNVLHLFRKDLTSGTEKELLPKGGFQIGTDVSPDGSTVVFQERAERGDFDLWTLPLSGEPTPSPFVRSPFNEINGCFSPDGHNVAYVSDESGRGELYVAPFPATGRKTRVSSGGGWDPRWSRDGHELFYLSDEGQVVSVPVRLAPTLELGSPVPLFTVKGGKGWSDYDVSLDGKKFLAIVPEVVADEQPLTVILNWAAEIKR